MKKQKAFTLIELLVVIAIIAILMGVLMPALRAARRQAGKAVCLAHVKQILLCVKLYAADWDGKTHRSKNNGLWDDAHEGPAVVKEFSPEHSWAYWGIAYKQYCKDKEIFRCPSQVRVDDWPENGWGRSYQKFFKYCSYGINGYVTWHYASSAEANADTGRPFKIDAHAWRPAEMIFLQDHLEQRLEVRSDSFTISDGANINLTQWRNGGTVVGGIGRFPEPEAVNECFRHQRKSVTAWADGHASTIRETTGEDVPRRWYTGLRTNDRWYARE